MHPQAARGVRPQAQHIQLPGQQQRGRQGKGDEPAGGVQPFVAHPRQTAHQKAVGVVQAVRQHGLDGVDARGQNGADGHPRQGDGHPARPGDPGDAVDQQAGRQRPQEGRPGQQPQRLREQGDEQAGRQARPGVDADDIGSGHGVLQHRLDHRAGHRQRRSGQNGGAHPGQPHIGQDAEGRVGGIPRQRRPHRLHHAGGGRTEKDRAKQAADERRRQQNGGGPRPCGAVPVRTGRGRGSLPDIHSFHPSVHWACNGTGPGAAAHSGPPARRKGRSRRGHSPDSAAYTRRQPPRHP